MWNLGCLLPHIFFWDVCIALILNKNIYIYGDPCIKFIYRKYCRLHNNWRNNFKINYVLDLMDPCLNVQIYSFCWNILIDFCNGQYLLHRFYCIMENVIMHLILSWNGNSSINITKTIDQINVCMTQNCSLFHPSFASYITLISMIRVLLWEGDLIFY